MNEPRNSVSSDLKDEHLYAGDLLKWIFARNPFYLISAGLLLYAIYRLSIDPQLFATELGQLFFNFGSFQVYELLLVGTGIYLVRRKIWYDSSLLIALENFLVLVPFILISQALLIEGHVAALFCIGATALVACRFAGIKKYFRNINFPLRLLLAGGVMLGVNVGLPLFVKALHNGASTEVWSVRGAQFYQLAWMMGVPLILAMANLLPRPRGQGEMFVEKSYFPLVISVVWTLVASIHLYSVGYVYALKWTHAFLLPALWVGTWTLWNRFYDFDICDEETEADLHQMLLLPTMLLPFFAVFGGEWNLFLGMAAVNVVLYAVLLIRDRNRFVFHLMMISGAMILAGLPRPVFEALHLELSRRQACELALAAYIFIRAVLSRNPKMGMLGGLVTSVCAAIFFDRERYAMDVALHMGALFVVLHSLRWVDGEHPGASTVRNVAGFLWIGQSILWLIRDGSTAWAVTASFSIMTLAVYVAVKLILNSWGPRIVPGAAVIILLAKPALMGWGFFSTAPVGVLALLGSFLLFGIGTLAALTRNHWNKNERAVAVVNPIDNTTL